MDTRNASLKKILCSSIAGVLLFSAPVLFAANEDAPLQMMKDINQQADNGDSVGIDLPVIGSPKKTVVSVAGQPIVQAQSSNGLIALARIISEASKYVSILAMIAITWGGIIYITSYGDEKKLGQAKRIILFSLLAVVLSVSAYAIIDLINSIKIG